MTATLEADGTPSRTLAAPANACDDSGRCLTETVAQEAAARLEHRASAQVSSVDIEAVREGPPLPFDLGTLQEVCSAKLGLGVQETLAAAQALYENHKGHNLPTNRLRLPAGEYAG